ncbi:alpha/beta fold hydrolase [Rubrobacter marinus]|uniref:alpha/beta fold hydrolase n=1 Tax=Rubrobacter marinus TaxID=2653852 RepID=UPI00140804C4|nr:alpha/beta hydrolase [Rubrobacter marinus]
MHGVTASSATFWRVGPWFAERGWRAVAVDLRGHGESPRMSGGEGLADLAADVHETVAPLLAPGEHIDVLLGHSLGALTALGLCAERPGLVRSLVLEEPPDSKGGATGFEGVTREVEEGIARTKEDPGAALRDARAENPSWSDEDVANSVAGGLACDAGPVAALVRGGLRGLDLPAKIGALEMPTLLVLGSPDRGSYMLDPERSAVAGALKHGVVETFEAGHSVHREDFEGYVRLLGRWLGRGETLRG